MNFTLFKTAVQKQLETMIPTGLFKVDLDKDLVWSLYLDSYEEGTNNLYKERREYDCNCCKQFIRAMAGVVTIKDNKIVSLWDFKVGSYYQPVADAMAALVKSHTVSNQFFSESKSVGTSKSTVFEGTKAVIWEHFHVRLPSEFVRNKNDIGGLLSETRSQKEVLKRSLDEISLSSIEIVLDLIDQKTLYRGEEHQRLVKTLKRLKKQYDKVAEVDKDNFCWTSALAMEGASKIRNTVIGTLLVDISEGMNLDKAVGKYEAKVAPANYKRPKALITKKMIANAQKEVADRGIQESLVRRYANIADININNVLYASSTAKVAMDVFDELAAAVPQKVGNLDKVEEVSIATFMDKVVPNATEIELFVENKHTNNFVSLVAPSFPDSPNILKWGNNFTWNYNGEMADSLRDKVQSLGGRVDGVLRFTHTWNYDGNNQSLMDLHVFMPTSTGNHKDGEKGKEKHDLYPSGERVGWNNRRDYQSNGVQDVDFVDAPGTKVPVENITFPDMNRLQEGKYIFKIHNWSARQNPKSGFRAEIEANGEVYEYEYTKAMENKEWITVAEATLKNGVFTMNHFLKPSTSSREIWNINTQNFQKVTTIMNSPNHWDGEETGNKHLFFMLEGCYNSSPARGFYNEFLNDNLRDIRKVFEVLASKMKTSETEDQLSGLGFSSTQRNQAIFRVTGSFSRIVKVNF